MKAWRRLGIVALLAPVGPSLAVIAWAGAQDLARSGECSENLARLWRIQNIYTTQFGGPEHLMPIETGRQFWLKLNQTSPPLISDKMLDFFQCPVEGRGGDECDYRGPSPAVNRYAEGDPVGADEDGNHGADGGGNVLYKSGAVLSLGSLEDRGRAAAAKLTSGDADSTATQRRTARQQAIIDMEHLRAALGLYRDYHGRLPKRLSDLVERSDADEFWPRGGWTRTAAIAKDPWGRGYLYEARDDERMLRTLGADGEVGGSGEDEDLDLSRVLAGRADLQESPASIAANEQSAAACLRAIASAQIDFRANDRDGNRVAGFWIADVSGLYYLCPSANGKDAPKNRSLEEAFKLIEQSVADADAARQPIPGKCDRPAKPTPRRGYVFRTIPMNRKGEPFEPETTEPVFTGRRAEEWAVCAMPAEHGKTGRRTFFVTEDLDIWAKDSGGARVTQVPANPKADGWTKVE